MSNYLDRPLVEGINFNITNEEIKIDCSHTLYINAKRIKNTITKDSILELYKKVYRLAKDKKISIGTKRGYKKYIDENWNLYTNEIKYYNNLFDQVITEFKKVQIRGIHSGTTDDEILDNAHNIQNKYSQVFYGTSVYDHINSIYNDLKKLFEGITNDNNIYTKIYL